MFDTGTTSKTLKIRTQGVPYFSFIYLFIFNIKLNKKKFFNFFFIWVWPSHCCNTVVTCRYVPNTANLKEEEQEQEQEEEERAEF